MRYFWGRSYSRKAFTKLFRQLLSLEDLRCRTHQNLRFGRSCALKYKHKSPQINVVSPEICRGSFNLRERIDREDQTKSWFKDRGSLHRGLVMKNDRPLLSGVPSPLSCGRNRRIIKESIILLRSDISRFSSTAENTYFSNNFGPCDDMGVCPVVGR